jgi:spore germination protein YaaH
MVTGWIPYWTTDTGQTTVETARDLVSEVSPFWFRATGADTIVSDEPANEQAAVVQQARAANLPVVPAVRDGMPARGMAAVLADPAQRSRHVAALVRLVESNGYAGIDLDYEQFAFADGRDTWRATRPNWVAFVTELADRLHADGRTLTVSVPPVYDAQRTARSGYWVYDYGAIAPVVDRIRVMAYDYSNSSSDPGPIAPLDWVRRIVAGTTAAAGDPSKLVLGVPLYGYNWPVATSGDCPDGRMPGLRTVMARSVNELAQRRNATPVHDDTTAEWSFSYRLVAGDGASACTQTRQVNYVGADGIQQRVELALDAGFAGAALFALGYEDEAVWDTVDAVNEALRDAGAAASTVPS